MTKEEALEKAAEKILADHDAEISRNGIAKMISQRTNVISTENRNQQLKRLKQEQEEYLSVYKHENPLIKQEIDQIYSQIEYEKINAKSIDNIMEKIAFVNRVEEVQKSFTDPTEAAVFQNGINKYGREVFMSAYDEAEGNVFQALLFVSGSKDMSEYFEKIKLEERDEREFVLKMRGDRDGLMLEKVSQMVEQFQEKQEKQRNSEMKSYINSMDNMNENMIEKLAQRVSEMLQENKKESSSTETEE